MTRETIYAALFALFSGSTVFKTKSRRLKSFDQVSSEEQPALFQIEIGEVNEQLKGFPVKRRFRAELYIYVNTKADPSAIPSTLVNNCLDEVEALMAPPVCQANQTLGGTVSHAWISGQIDIVEGDLGDQAAAFVPIEILVAT